MNLDNQMEQALQTFVVEAYELLAEMEGGLLAFETGGGGETVDALFRAAHTIKGSAGLFGLDAIVRFTHLLENLLDRLRAREIAVGSDLAALLLESRDHLVHLVDGVANGAEPDSQSKAVEESLIRRLRASLGMAEDGSCAASAVPRVYDGQISKEGGTATAANWHLSLRFGPDILRNGMDPISFVRYLRTLGDIVGLVTVADALPGLAEMDPEVCYLGFEIGLKSDATKEAIEEVFEFVRDDSRIRILPAHGRIGEYLELIRSLPEDDLRLGEILVQVGTLTRRELGEALAEQRQADGAGEGHALLGEILLRQGVAQEPLVRAALEKQKEAKGSLAREGRFLRVPAEKLDALINLVGELVIASAGNRLLAQQGGNASQLEAAAQIARLVEEIRDGALRLRTVEIGETFGRFHRVVRDVSRELGKEIELVVTGGETELDKGMVERIADPLMHLVRNAVDHGIEPPDARIAVGKRPQGQLRLNAYHDSGSIVIEVADDGQGLDREKIFRKALERGIVGAGQALSDKEIYGLIFEPGFSTADKVTELSGRGVGMDVVKKNIESIRGTVEIDTTPGQGTALRIRLPLTLAIIDGFLVGVGGAVYVIPLDMVVECLEYVAAGTQGYINLRGEVLPLVRLRELFHAGAYTARRENVVVVRYGDQRAGLVVDELIGESQTVIKPLGDLFAHLQGIGGCTILGGGDVALILDVSSLIALAARGDRPSNAA